MSKRCFEDDRALVFIHAKFKENETEISKIVIRL